MLKYLFRRIISVIPVILIVTFLIFSIMHSIPGGPASSILGLEATPEEVARLNAQLGLDQPFLKQYLDWLFKAFKGDLGESYFMGGPVKDILVDYIRATVSLALVAGLISAIVGMTFAIISIFYRNTVIDKLIVTINLIGQGVPSFVISLINLIIFAVMLKVLPVSGYRPLSMGWSEHLKYLILPAMSISLGQAAYIARMSRAAMIRILDQPFILSATLKGVSKWHLFYHHILRNSLVPIITAIGQSLGSLLAGSIIVETIFGIPGLGQLLINSISRRDYAVIQAVILVISVTYILINLLVDISYALIDPRIRYEGSDQS